MADHPTTKSRRQIGKLLGNKKLLSPAQKKRLKSELKSGVVKVKG